MPDIKPKLLEKYQLEADLSIMMDYGTGSAHNRVVAHIKYLERQIRELNTTIETINQLLSGR
jgi:prefoldin subunit 5